MTVIGIDPGLTGAIAVLGRLDLPAITDMPTARVGLTNKVRIDHATLADILTGQRSMGDVTLVVVERQQAMPKQGVASTFQTGYGYGLIVGMLVALRLPWIDVRAAEWQRVVGWKGGKDGSRVLARQLYSGLRADTLARVKDHGRADAILIAHYALRHVGPPVRHERPGVPGVPPWAPYRAPRSAS